MFSEDMFANRINLDNPWWSSGHVEQEYTKAVPRFFLEKFYRYLTLDGVRRAILLMGPRRVGKTWLIQHAIARLLDREGVPAKNIVFLPIDVPVYHGCELEELVLEACKTSGASPATDKLYVFFDEI